ncbi:MAG: class III poly(R)-hydroxyalkanoic acid synthase subunit PhaE [Proteobacteria bacterium]|nr:class III poly(R)-hydroxyalkanoic acid synthase subunit PhaE [Pseudomonadota bacterium]
MSKKTFNPFDKTSFLEAQKAFIDAWSNLSRVMSHDDRVSNTTNVNNAWAQAMEFWGKTTNNMLPSDVQHVFTNLIEQAKIYNLLGEQFNSFINKYNTLDKSSEDWRARLESYFNEFATMFSGRGNEASNVFKQMLGTWHQLPMDTIQRTMSSASLMPGDFLQGLKNDALNAATEKYLSVPGIGYTRESQEAYLNGIRLWTDYQNALNDFNSANSRVGIQALEQLQKKIFALAEEGKEITSLRQIYDLWVDANEDAYAKFAYSKEYRKLYGELVNRLMKYKQYNQQIIDESLAAMNIPTRRGFDTLKERQQELRRTLFITKQTLKNHEKQVQELKNKIESLESEVAKKQSVSVKADKKKKTKQAAVKKAGSKKAKKKARKKAKKKATVSKPKPKAKSRSTKKQASSGKPATVAPGMTLIKF